jgi:hypothetical protein
MTLESRVAAAKLNRKWPKRLLMVFVVTVIACVVYVRTHPLVFNESFFGHAYCMKQTSMTFRMYAEDNFGRFPSHTNGYGDALLLLVPHYTPWSLLTGPGYDSNADKKWNVNGANVPESECGRVYIQGLTESNNPQIAILFDKIPTPGGDHCHLLGRLTAPLCRDVLLLDGSQETIRETKWQEFAANQIELLVKEGFDRATAEELYAEKGKSP